MKPELEIEQSEPKPALYIYLQLLESKVKQSKVKRVQQFVDMFFFTFSSVAGNTVIPNTRSM